MLPSRKLSALLAGVAILGLALPACETFDDLTDSDSDDSDDRPAGVARGAEIVESGRGDLSYTAPSRGAVYAVDATTGRTVHSRQIARGQEFVLDIGEDEILLDGRPVMKRDLKSDHAHAIWFRPERGAADADDMPDKNLPKDLRDARRIAAGTGDLAFTAPGDGDVFLYDRSSSNIVYRSQMRRGERLRVDADRNSIELEGQPRNAATAQRNKLYPNRQYVIYFDEK